MGVTAALTAALAIAAWRPVVTQGPLVIVPGIDKPVRVMSGRIRGTVTFTNDTYWVLRGAVFVEDGSTLNIQAGTTVVGEAGSIGTLIVLRGGKLSAIGTRAQPIVFTSDQAPGTRARGDWGGIILNGRAPVNLAGGEGEGEANTGIYGGTDPNDSSGVMRFVRVEFSGIEFSPDNELNGVALQGVGSGGNTPGQPAFDFIQVHMNKDDAVEFFGGTADAKHLVLTNAGDDSLDWTFGWSGRVQFVVVSQRGDDADAGIEADNNEFDNNALPRANPTIFNVTFCGDPDRNEGSESTRGWLLRRGTAGTLRNFIIQGFKTLGIEVNGVTTLAQVVARNLVVSNGVIFNTGATGTNFGPATTTAFFGNLFPNIVTGQDPGIGNCHNHLAPDWRPTSVATLAGGQLAPALPPNDGFFDVTTFIGGVGLGVDDWISNGGVWIATPAN
jgi:hypothetical protein